MRDLAAELRGRGLLSDAGGNPTPNSDLLLRGADGIDRLCREVETLARALDTAELMLKKDYPAEASSMRLKVASAKALSS